MPGDGLCSLRAWGACWDKAHRVSGKLRVPKDGGGWLGGDLESREQENLVGRGVESWMGRDAGTRGGGMWGRMLAGMCGAPAMKYTG